MVEVLKDDCPSYSTMKTKVWNDHFDVIPEAQSRRPTSTTAQHKTNNMSNMIIEDRHIAAEVIA